MGSLFAHVDQGVALTGLGLWWMFNILKEYIRVGGKDGFVPEVSYGANICGREIPIEIYVKMFFSFGGAMIELFDNGPVFIDHDGEFRKVTNLQHISIYGFFFIHSVLDLLRYRKVQIIDGLVYLTGALAFLWCGAIFHVHLQHNPDMLKTIVHNMATLWCVLSGLSILWECRSDDKFLPTYCRTLMVLGYGTWFIHTPFLLFSTDSFPGEHKNPLWERDNPANYQFVATMFGFHLIFNITISLVMFTILRCISKRTGSLKTMQFRRISNNDDDDDDTQIFEEKSNRLV